VLLQLVGSTPPQQQALQVLQERVVKVAALALVC
jgi:hypothetical protein